MPVIPRLEIENEKAVDEALASMAAAFSPTDSRGILRASLRATVEPLAEAIRVNTPVDTGQLRASTSIWSRVVNGFPTAMAGWRSAEINPVVFHVVERGTLDGRRPGVFPIQRALAGTEPEMRQGFLTKFTAALDQRAAAARRKAARAAGRVR